MDSFKLTQYSHGSGCGCKIAPADLEKILATHRSTRTAEQLLIGNNSNDDAAVWDIGNGQALISTVDFFLPVVDDAFDFGRIAAANALSDVYAMGGKPVFANVVLGWPIEKLPAELATEVLNGARNICEKVNVAIAGGHSINSSDPIFGLSVNGFANVGHIKRNNTARSGDFLYLTKPLGIGVLSTAIKRGVAHSGHIQEVVELMCSLNTIGEKLGAQKWVHSMTDITGFGLLGHLTEMAEGSNLTAQLRFNDVPLLSCLDEYLKLNTIPDNTYRNWNAYEKKVSGLTDMKAFQVLNDPQTSGGLLISVAAEHAQEADELFAAEGVHAVCIGQFVPEGVYSIEVIL
ncbi:MAG: selenide, water dikinase SelD [Bacteroidia bacterium]|nr:selenide, water dikinase SelD [Bacteroidia bacterium]